MDCQYVHKAQEGSLTVYLCDHPETKNDFETHYCPIINGRDNCPYGVINDASSK